MHKRLASNLWRGLIKGTCWSVWVSVANSIVLATTTPNLFDLGKWEWEEVDSWEIRGVWGAVWRSHVFLATKLVQHWQKRAGRSIRIKREKRFFHRWVNVKEERFKAGDRKAVILKGRGGDPQVRLGDLLPLFCCLQDGSTPLLTRRSCC